jgi:hypothetical protein
MCFAPTSASLFCGFYDILIYNTTWAEHLQHVLLVLVLQQHKLAVKQSKCSFGATLISYLDHIISDTRVAMDPVEVKWCRLGHAPRLSRDYKASSTSRVTTVNSSRIMT